MMQSLNPKDAKVLIVEDNRDDIIIASRALKAFGIKHIFSAQTGEEALAYLTQHKCDVALVDHRLPGMSGLRLLEQIRAARPETRVIVVTGARDERVAAAAIKLGASDYVSKDEFLTSGIINSLQAALREEIAEQEEQRRLSLWSGTDRLADKEGRAVA